MINKALQFSKPQMRKIKIVDGSKRYCFNRRKVTYVSEVSFIIWLSIPRAAFEGDFLTLLSPNLKKDFIASTISRYYKHDSQHKHTKKMNLQSKKEKNFIVRNLFKISIL